MMISKPSPSTLRSVALSAIPALLLAAAALAAPLAWRTTTVRPDVNTRVEVRHVDPEKFDVSAVTEEPPVRVKVVYRGKTVMDRDLKGYEGWTPWLLHGAVARDVDGDGVKETLVSTGSHHGGSGEMLYLTVIRRRGEGFALIDLPRTAQENIQTGAYYLARDAKGGAAFVVTYPLMDGPSRADATRWKLTGCRLDGDKTATVWTKTTTKRWNEAVPKRAVEQALPRGWRLVAQIQ